jgi:uncharacterized membrane protein YqhA
VSERRIVARVRADGRRAHAEIVPAIDPTRALGPRWRLREMKAILRASRYVMVIAVAGCLVMFAAVTIFGVLAVLRAIVELSREGTALTQVPLVTVAAFKILDLFLLGGILYIVALGLGALFLDAKSALPAWYRVRELRDLKVVLSQSVIVLLLVDFLGDVLEWERGTDIAFVGVGLAMVIAAVAYQLREMPAQREDGTDSSG